MKINKRVNVLWCTLVLAVTLDVSGCSRQQSDWQKTREANTADAYELFLKKYPSGEFTAQAQARVKELYQERDWQKARDADTPEAYQAFLKQYSEGKWAEEARIRVENFTLAQAPGAGGPTPSAATPAPTGPVSTTTADSATPATTTPPASSEKPSTVPRRIQTPSTAPKVAATTSPKTSSKSHGSASGHYGIQLGAFKTGAKAADQRWHRLQKEYPSVLAGLSFKVSPKKTAGGTLYRLQAVGLTEKRARSVCGTLKAKSQACVILPPTRS